MSAPEPYVRVLYRPGESIAPGYPWVRLCEGCHERAGYWATRSDCEYEAAEHENACPAIQLARLQARWDARDKAERALIGQWRTAPERIGSGRMAVGYAAGRTDSADELERAIGGGR